MATRRVKIGDIVEIETKDGLRYGQYSDRHKSYGAVLRMFGGAYSIRPESFDEMVQQEPVFICLVPLGAAVSRGIFAVAGNAALPLAVIKFPLFRSGIVDPSTRKVRTWWLWDGESEWRIGDLTEAQRKLPIRGVWNDTMLIHRLESGWTPETDST
ncbi:hypothetical protein [Roseateles aquatilis]|uniref:hypothetical protein n=1 Tax=Roseateles aquatilis TaxID=431061 RepID=UPI00112FD6DD|nr:hypothetical protein [Roseateles aquatilis]